MTSEWDGTSWGGTPIPRQEIVVPREGMATAVKAATGLDRYLGKPMLADVARSRARVMREAQSLYYTNPWIGLAERTVTRKVAALPWHIEDEGNDEVDDTASPQLQAIRDLFEKPQAAIPYELRQPGLSTRRGLISIISRHMGLCGVSYVIPDGRDRNGLPNALLYVNPARVSPKVSDRGNILAWAIDADDYGNGGTLYRPEELIPFYLEVPDWGAETSGLVEAARLKARISTASDVHALGVLQRGGRTPGLISPKDGYISDPDQYAQLERDLRTAIEQDPDRRRDIILRGPVDFNATGSNPQQLGLDALATMTKDDILAIWGVPVSQAGVKVSRGLNGNEGGAHEYEVLMSGPVHDRVTVIFETFQYELLDRWRTVGLDPQLVIEEPTFDDLAPVYDLAQKSLSIALTNNERRALINEDPLPDYGPDGEPLGVAIWVPATITPIAQGAEEGADAKNPFPNAPKPDPKPEPPVNLGILPPPPVPQLGTGAPPPVPTAGKAGLGLRPSIDKRVVPQVRKALASFLSGQREDIAARIAAATPRQLKDASYWFRGEVWDKALEKALRPHVAGIARTVAGRAKDLLAAKAAFADEIEQYVTDQTALRITGINQTTRDRIAEVIRSALADELTISDIASRIRELDIFDEARSELIARTESAFAYNTAAIGSYREYGVSEVQAIDGDQDEECASRDGRTFSIEEAGDIEDHPNGTLDWIPVVPVVDEGKARHDDTVDVLMEALRAASGVKPLIRTVIDYDDAGNVIGAREMVDA